MQRWVAHAKRKVRHPLARHLAGMEKKTQRDATRPNIRRSACKRGFLQVSKHTPQGQRLPTPEASLLCPHQFLCTSSTGTPQPFLRPSDVMMIAANWEIPNREMMLCYHDSQPLHPLHLLDDLSLSLVLEQIIGALLGLASSRPGVRVCQG